LVAVALPLLSAPACALAQTTAPAAASVEELIVTAQRRAEALSSVPIAVTAMTGEALARQRIFTASDLATVTPNLQAVSTVGEETPIFALRGVAMSDYSLNQSAPVATYFDEVYKGNFALLGVALYDLDRVEVLRGPQGTLYGKNTTGGAVNLVARRPDFGPASGELSLGVGNYNRREASGAVQASTNDILAGRLAFTYAKADGWFKNRSPGQGDLNGTDEYGVRLSVLFRPSDKAEFILRASISDQTPNNYGVLAQPGPDGIGAGVYSLFHSFAPALVPQTDDFRVGLGNRELTSSFTPKRKNRTDSVALTATFTLPHDLKLISVSSWDKGSLTVPEDTDGSHLQVLSIDYSANVEQVAEDIRIQSNGAGPFNFTLGAYYNRERLTNATSEAFYNDLDVNLDGVLNVEDCIDGLPLGCRFANSFRQIKTSWAIYGDSAYALTDQLKMRVGLRYSHDEGRQEDFISQAMGTDGIVIANLIPGDAADLGATTNLSFSKGEVSGKLGLDYTTAAGSLAYASYSRGYRASGFNAQAFFDPSELTVSLPETVDALEAGWKSHLFDRRVQLNAAAFWYGYHNQQFIDASPDLTQRLLNLPRSTIYGGELEIVARPVGTLTLTGSLGLLRSRIDEGVVQGVSVVGNRLPNAPELTFTGMADWDAFRVGQVAVGAHVKWSHVSDQEFDSRNQPSIHGSSYDTVDGSITLAPDPANWQVAVWGKNLANVDYYTSRLDGSGLGFIYNHINPPRTYGVTLTARF
jgi:iron complex outermembrane receptor protein